VSCFDYSKLLTRFGPFFQAAANLITISMLDGYMSPKELRHITDFGQQLGMNQHQVHAEIQRATVGEFNANQTLS